MHGEQSRLRFPGIMFVLKTLQMARGMVNLKKDLSLSIDVYSTLFPFGPTT